MAESETEYGMGARMTERVVLAPELAYRPPEAIADMPIGLIGCGGISGIQLKSYRNAGFRVAALCDRNPAKAMARRAEYFPGAEVYSDYRSMLARKDLVVVDITTHPGERAVIIEDAILAGKHVLSQKPFVLDLDAGHRLADLAEAAGVKIAVNQNGRWAPHIGYINQAIRQGLLGEIASVDFSVFWDHSWIRGTPFNDVDDLVLCDFAIHWFDFLTLFMAGRKAMKVFAASAHAPGQAARPPLLAEVNVEFSEGLGHMAFDGSVLSGQVDRTVVTGSSGTIVSQGPDLNRQEVALHTAAGIARPVLEGRWFKEGFQGAMAELLASIEQGREPSHHARGNLDSLALCFAAIASSRDHVPKVPGEIRTLPGYLRPAA